MRLVSDQPQTHNRGMSIGEPHTQPKESQSSPGTWETHKGNSTQDGQWVLLTNRGKGKRDRARWALTLTAGISDELLRFLYTIKNLEINLPPE